MKVRSSTRATSAGIGTARIGIGAFGRIKLDHHARGDHLVAQGDHYSSDRRTSDAVRLAQRRRLFDPVEQLLVACSRRPSSCQHSLRHQRRLMEVPPGNPVTVNDSTANLQMMSGFLNRFNSGRRVAPVRSAPGRNYRRCASGATLLPCNSRSTARHRHCAALGGCVSRRLCKRNETSPHCIQTIRGDGRSSRATIPSWRRSAPSRSTPVSRQPVPPSPRAGRRTRSMVAAWSSIHVLENARLGIAQPGPAVIAEQDRAGINPVDAAETRDQMSPGDGHAKEPEILKSGIRAAEGWRAMKRTRPGRVGIGPQLPTAAALDRRRPSPRWYPDEGFRLSHDRHPGSSGRGFRPHPLG